jgi:hypothetical protein
MKTISQWNRGGIKLENSVEYQIKQGLKNNIFD